MSADDSTRRGAMPPALARGQQIAAGRFTLLRPLGRGGMGKVWLAQDARFKESVAITFLPEAIRADSTAFESLRHETVRSSKLSHPHIVRIHDLHEDGALAFIAMEYVDGPTLAAERLQSPNRLIPWEELMPMVLQVCEALKYAHGQNVVHGSIKPTNIIVAAKGRAKLADFGIATTHQTTLETMVYSSPQRLNGEKPQLTDDIYSFGATLFEMLTSSPPFFWGDIPEQIRNIPAPSVAERLSELNLSNDIPPHVGELIASCLAKAAFARPQTASEMLTLLREPARSTLGSFNFLNPRKRKI